MKKIYWKIDEIYSYCFTVSLDKEFKDVSKTITVVDDENPEVIVEAINFLLGSITEKEFSKMLSRPRRKKYGD